MSEQAAQELDRLLSQADTNPMLVSVDMVQRGAEVLLGDYASEYVAEHLTWRDFAEQALRVLSAGLRDTRWEDG